MPRKTVRVRPPGSVSPLSCFNEAAAHAAENRRSPLRARAGAVGFNEAAAHAAENPCPALRLELWISALQ